MRAITFALAVAVTLGATTASAADGAAQTSPPSDWYGWQTLIADAADAGLWALGSQMGGAAPVLLLPAALGYLVTVPIIHCAHDSPARAGISLGMRLALPLVGGLVGAVVQASSSSAPAYTPGEESTLNWNVEGLLYGAGVGMVLAAVLDATVLAWQPPPSLRPSPPPWVPTTGVAYDLGHHATPTFGVGGTF